VSRFIIEGKNRKSVSLYAGSDFEQRILTIDSKGRVSIPADIRRSFGLVSGCRLNMEFDLEEGFITLFQEEEEEYENEDQG
jgi:AbrB family looped-hinge helix DNA binding protein